MGGNERDRVLPGETAWFTGGDGVLQALEASRPDLVLNAITGAAGLPSSEWALARGIPLALANKESMVMAGSYLVGLAEESGAAILPSSAGTHSCTDVSPFSVDCDSGSGQQIE